MVDEQKSPAARTSGEPELPPTVIEMIAREEESDRKFLRIAFVLAAIFHLAMFVITWPSFAAAVKETKAIRAKVYVVKQVKFKQPPPRQEQQQQILRTRTKKVPIPDPTPDEPEPIRDEAPEDNIDFIADDNLILGVPDAAPAPPSAEPTGPIRFVVGGKITEPEKLSGPVPLYPEAARRARIQGVVVLECIIGKSGDVTDVKVLRGLPLGLTESAVDAVRSWKFKPSTLNEKPVEVLYILTVRFNLQ
jgi:TonB family protein